MTNEQREQFQKQHGREWASIINQPSFNAGMVHLSVEALDRIRRLTDEEIRENSIIILSDLRGRLWHETELLSLPVIIEAAPTGDIAEEYPNSVDELYQEQLRKKKLESNEL